MKMSCVLARKHTDNTSRLSPEERLILRMKSEARRRKVSSSQRRRNILRSKVAASAGHGDLIEGVCFTAVHTEENEGRYGGVRNEAPADPEGDSLAAVGPTAASRAAGTAGGIGAPRWSPT